MEQKLTEAANFMFSEGTGVALTGAGISAESGILTYRDPGGLWDRFREGAEGGILGVIRNRPEEASTILSEFFARLQAARPNPGHHALADMQRMGSLTSVITQNIDNLHREAGSTLVLELHGNMFRLRCMQCGKKRPLGRDEFFSLAQDLVLAVRVSFDAMIDALPRCECEGVMRPDFVGFGEAVQDLDAATAESETCSWMLIIGTSGLVHPAASLPYRAMNHGAVLIEVNPKESELSSIADVVIRAPSAEALPRLVNMLKEMNSEKQGGQ